MRFLSPLPLTLRKTQGLSPPPYARGPATPAAGRYRGARPRSEPASAYDLAVAAATTLDARDAALAQRGPLPAELAHIPDLLAVAVSDLYALQAALESESDAGR